MAKPLTMMIVEKSPRAQTLLKKFFGQFGFRILVSASPTRAIAMASDPTHQINVVVVSALEIGEQAVAAFNALSAEGAETTFPAVLIMNSNNAILQNSVRCDTLRKIIFTPLRIPVVAAVLSELLATGIGVSGDDEGAFGNATPPP